MAVGFLILISVWATSAQAGVNQGRHRRHIVEDFTVADNNHASAGTVFPILGIGGAGKKMVYPRLEIRELERRRDQFNLYLLGLQRFQGVSQDDEFSYFRIAGIHGRPFTPWDGVEKNPEGKLGYCRHSSNIFPTWHRPYLALIEEAIYNNAREVIAEFPVGDLKNRMNNALPSLRLPYWDAAAVPPVGEGSYPWCVQRQTIEVELPDGASTKRIMIPNPLYSYTFHPLPVEDFRSQPANTTKRPDRWLEWTSTKRFPTTFNASAQSQDNQIAFHLDWNSENFRQRTYFMLAIQNDYYSFSNDMVHIKDPDHGVLDSLESVHDTLHNIVGESGHMTVLEYSAFDPIFWLLHGNTDRMLAVWQSLHPDSYVANHTNVLATFTTPPRSWADENTPLHPFHRNEAGDFWTSTLVRDHTVFGYTYPELVGLTDNATLVRRVNALYGENATSQFSWDQKQGYDIPPAQSTSTNVLNAPKPTPISSLSSQSAQRLDVQYHYFANIRTPNSQTTGAYKVFVFFDAVRTASESPDTMLWMHDPGLVGFAGFPGKGSMAGEDAHEANSVVALTRALEERVKTGELASMDGDAVAAYLRAHLSWRAEPTVDVEVEVTWAAFTPPRPDAFPLLKPGGVRRLFDE